MRAKITVSYYVNIKPGNYFDEAGSPVTSEEEAFELEKSYVKEMGWYLSESIDFAMSGDAKDANVSVTIEPVIE